MGSAKISTDRSMKLAGIDLNVRATLSRRAPDLGVELVAEVL